MPTIAGNWTANWRCRPIPGTGPTNILASEQSFAACGKLPFPTWSPANDRKFSGATPNKFLMRLQAYGRDYAFAA
jgi:hypothetical protein